MTATAYNYKMYRIERKGWRPVMDEHGHRNWIYSIKDPNGYSIGEVQSLRDARIAVEEHIAFRKGCE